MDKERQSALHCASSCGNAAAVKLLLEAGADIEAKDEFVSHRLCFLSTFTVRCIFIHL